MKLFNHIFLVTVVSATASVSTHAENIYIFKDDGGQTLLTNVGHPSGNFQKFKKQVAKKTYKSYRKPAKNYYKTNANANYGRASKYGRSNYSNNRNRNSYDNLIRSSANRYGVDPALVKAIIHTESNFKANARSHVGAQGLMQLMPGTARELRVSNPWNPAENIDGGTRYIAQLLKRFNNNAELALAGYNAGPHRQSLREGRIPNIRETQNYVKRVLSRYHNLYKNDPSLRGRASSSLGNGIKKITYKRSNNANIGKSSSYTQSAFDALR